MSELTGIYVGAYVPQVQVGLPYFIIPQTQPQVVNDFPSTNLIANCRLCLGTYFGAGSTTILNEQLIVMMKQVFPILIVNQVGLPMNVCGECVNKIETFYTFSTQVLVNEQKLLQSSMQLTQPNQEEAELRQSVELANQNQETPVLQQTAGQEEHPIDADLLIKIEPDTDLEEPDPLTAANDIVFDVVNEIPGIKMEDEMLTPAEIKIEEEPELQLEDKEEVACHSSSETFEEGYDQEKEEEERLPNKQPKPKRKRIFPLTTIPTLNFCPLHTICFEHKQISNMQELIEFNRRLHDDDYMNQLISVLRRETRKPESVALMKEAMKILFDKDLRCYVTMNGHQGTVPLPTQEKVLELFNKLASPKGKRMPHCQIRELVYNRLKYKTWYHQDPLSEPKRRVKVYPSHQMFPIGPPDNCCELKLKRITNEPLLRQFNRLLKNDEFMQKIIKYLQYLTGEARSKVLMYRSLQILVDSEFLGICYWAGKPGAVSLQRYRRFLELIARLGTSEGERLPAHQVRTFFQNKLPNIHRRFRAKASSRTVTKEVTLAKDAELPSEGAQQESLSDPPQTAKDGNVQQAQSIVFPKEQSMNRTADDYTSLQLKQITSKEELDEFNRQLEDEDYMTQVINYLQFDTGLPTSLRLMNKSLDILLERQFFTTANWTGKVNKIKFSSYSRILELFSRLGATDGVKLSECEIHKYFIGKFGMAMLRIRQITYTRAKAYKPNAQETKDK